MSPTACAGAQSQRSKSSKAPVRACITVHVRERVHLALHDRGELDHGIHSALGEHLCVCMCVYLCVCVCVCVCARARM